MVTLFDSSEPRGAWSGTRRLLEFSVGNERVEHVRVYLRTLLVKQGYFYSPASILFIELGVGLRFLSSFRAINLALDSGLLTTKHIVLSPLIRSTLILSSLLFVA